MYSYEGVDVSFWFIGEYELQAYKVELKTYVNYC